MAVHSAKGVADGAAEFSLTLEAQAGVEAIGTILTSGAEEANGTKRPANRGTSSFENAAERFVAGRSNGMAGVGRFGGKASVGYAAIKEKSQRVPEGFYAKAVAHLASLPQERAADILNGILREVAANVEMDSAGKFVDRKQVA